MGTETHDVKYQLLTLYPVKLNNPLMGTETINRASGERNFKNVKLN